MNLYRLKSKQLLNLVIEGKNVQLLPGQELTVNNLTNQMLSLKGFDRLLVEEIKDKPVINDRRVSLDGGLINLNDELIPNIAKGASIITDNKELSSLGSLNEDDSTKSSSTLNNQNRKSRKKE